MIDEKARKGLQKYLVKETDCEVQDGWPCGTCFMGLLNRLGLDDTHPDYKVHNDDHERHNEVWRAILQIREAK